MAFLDYMVKVALTSTKTHKVDMSYSLLICNYRTSSGSYKQKGAYKISIAQRISEDKRSRLRNYTAKNNAMIANHAMVQF